jgi:hypothetical protein
MKLLQIRRKIAKYRGENSAVHIKTPTPELSQPSASRLDPAATNTCSSDENPRQMNRCRSFAGIFIEPHHA